MNINRKLFFLTIIGILLVLNACSKKSAALQEETEIGCKAEYNRNIKPLVILKCATENCHVANFPFGNFTGYGDLKSRIDNGRVNTLVFEQKLMPPSNSPQLSAEELAQLKYWIENGALEN